MGEQFCKICGKTETVGVCERCRRDLIDKTAEEIARFLWNAVADSFTPHRYGGMRG